MENYSELVNITEQQIKYLEQMTAFIDYDKKRAEEEGKPPRNVRSIMAFIDTQMKVLRSFTEILDCYKAEYEEKEKEEAAKRQDELAKIKHKTTAKKEETTIDLFAPVSSGGPAEEPTDAEPEEPLEEEPEEGIENEEDI